jgi:hypothetical protein
MTPEGEAEGQRPPHAIGHLLIGRDGWICRCRVDPWMVRSPSETELSALTRGDFQA